MYRHQENWKEAVNHIKIYLKEALDSHRGHYQLALYCDAFYKNYQPKNKHYESYINRFKNEQITHYFINIAANRLQKLKDESLKDSKK